MQSRSFEIPAFVPSILAVGAKSCLTLGAVFGLLVGHTDAQALLQQRPVQGGTLQFVAGPESATIVSIDNTFGFPQKVGTKMGSPRFQCNK